MATNVYIDGFNLFNGCLKKSPYKWLDLDALCRTLLPGHQIHRIRYFTAAVLAFPHNPLAPINQQIYLRALSTIPNLTIHKDGWFASHPATLPESPLVYPNGPTLPPKLVRVVKMEEKRTDVDIATHLLVDCFKNDFDAAAVISNDSDLSLPIQMVKSEFHKNIVVINPHEAWKKSKELAKAASSQMGTINTSVLRNCQLPYTLTDSTGAFTKPPTW